MKTPPTPSAVNYDGSRIVGTSTGPTGSRAVMWTSTLGSVDLNTYLPTLGRESHRLEPDRCRWHLLRRLGHLRQRHVQRRAGRVDRVGHSVPEPSTLLLAAVGAIALIVAPRRTLATQKKIEISSSRGRVPPPLSHYPL